MCTVSWMGEGGSYTVFFNRDEMKKRAVAEPPAIRSRRGVHFMAPVDPEHGGTWLGVNAYGVTCGVVNQYPIARPASAPAEYVSRGQLVRSLMDCRSQTDVQRRLQTMSLQYFRPFQLLAFEPFQPVDSVIWDGRDLVRPPQGVVLPVISTAYPERERVRENRRACLPAVRNEITLEAYHKSHHPVPGALSVCMHRAETETVSFSRIRVDPHRIEFFYVPGPPCCTQASGSVMLDRVPDLDVPARHPLGR